jgi:alpha-mannosidase
MARKGEGIRPFLLSVCLKAHQLYPEGFANVKEKVFAGQFQPVGGAWLEHDGNMPSGEGMVRQNLLGQRYFQSRFGVRCETAWLPDSFGLSGALPQILRLSGMKVRLYT